MARSNRVGMEMLKGMFYQSVKFDDSIAHDVWVWGQASFILLEKYTANTIYIKKIKIVLEN